jgi:hypothetical protein
VLSWLKRLFGPAPPFRPRPPEWRKTLQDLDAEKRNLSGEEIEWARDFEREQLRAWARFPKDGEVFEALHDVKVSRIVHSGPTARGGDTALPKGTRVRVWVPQGVAEPVGVQALLAGEDPKSGDSSLHLHVAQLNREFRLVEDGRAAG